jgi:predicted  nucleic acid-binding Zn-ribbon protein
VLSDVVDASEIEEELTALVQEAEPTLDSITTVLTDVRDLVQDVRDQISTGVDMAEEIKDLINSPTGGQIEITNISAELELVMKDIVLSATTQDLARLDDLAIEWRSRIEQEIRDAFYATELVADIQEAVKERLFDLQASFNEAVDSAFAALNDAIREALSDVLAELDTSINNTLGSFGDKLGAGSLTGYARINRDSLEELRIDGAFELDVPDPLSLNAYLIVKSLDSDGPEACSGAAGAMTTEVTIGTTDMAIGLTGLGGDGVHADMSVKFGLNSTGVPVSMGGAFEMTSGTISFETFEIYKLAADVMFGSTENYLAAAIGLRFGEYDVAGGVFLGKSCDLDPLKMIDPLVAEVVPTSTITGIYAYGEATFPIYGTGTCFFNISAKAGAGVFYFQEGPTYGGRMTLGVYGEALCAVEVGAEISLAGSKSGDSYNFAGHGRVYGQAGKCPLCVKANFQVDFKYTDAAGWDVDF